MTRKILYRVALIVFLLIVVLTIIRIFSGEDGWICQNGKWVKHGHPSANQPTDPCGEVEIAGNDQDEHGCIGSAGYSWCEKKDKCLRIWEEKCE